MAEVNGVNGPQDRPGYTRVTVKDKDSNTSFVINFKNARVTGNEAKWEIRDGVLYDKNGKPVEDNIMEVTRYQAALIRAAAGDDTLDENDLCGANYANAAKDELAKSKSEFRLDVWDTGANYDDNGNIKTFEVPAADASEAGVFEADVVNNDGEKGHLTIDIRTPEQLAAEQRHVEEAQKLYEHKPWWKFW